MIMSRLNCVIFLLFCLNITNYGKADFMIGGLFDDNVQDEKAFKYALRKINAQREEDNLFKPLLTELGEGGPFEAMTATCNFLAEQAIAVIGPKNEDGINIVQSVCDNKDIPHLITRWVFKPSPYTNTINFYPSSDKLAMAYLDIVTTWEWKTFTVLYENNESLLRVSELIKKAKENGVLVSVQQLDPNSVGDYRTNLKEIRNSGELRLVIDCRLEVLESVLQQAQQVGMMTSDYNYFITNLDMHSADMEPFQYCEANITGIRIVNEANIEEYLPKKHDFPAKTHTETALLIDAVTVLSKAIEMSAFPSLVLDDVLCNTSKSFLHGTTLTNYIRGTSHNGLTGIIKFDHQGLRSAFDLEVLELQEDGIVTIGAWNSSKGLNIRRNQTESVEDSGSLVNTTFVVITCLTDPFGMLKETAAPLHGNDRFEGFGIDLIRALGEMEGFNYTFIIRADKKNGAKDPITGKWSGMIGDLMEYRADLAITDLTITEDRQSAVDFTSPFMNLGISILAKKPGKAPPSFFSFADPFGLTVWGMMALAYAVVSFSFFVLGRLSPDEWTNPYPCIEEPEFLINQFSLQNSAWFTIGSLMQQGTEIAPIGIATRMLAGMWWFFVLIMVSSYTANLAAFLTTENPINLFTDVESLVENMEKHDIHMGAKAGGATAGFFMAKDGEPFKTIAMFMQSHPEDMVTDNKDGVRKAENSTYAFFMESTSIEYETQRHCNLMQYGKLLDDKGYGIAMRKNSPYRKRLSMAILKLQSSGELDLLKRKWWEERRGGGQCSGDSDAQEATPLNLENVEGVFYVTIGGAVCSLLCVLLEMLLSTWKMSYKAHIGFREALRNEYRSYIDFSSNVKAVPVMPGSGSDSSKGSAESDEEGKLKPDPYGFITVVSKEALTND